MAEIYAVSKGRFGQMEVVQFSHDLVMHSHHETHLGFWLCGGSAYANVGPQKLPYGRDVALALNSLVSHDLRLDHDHTPACFLMLYLDNTWLDESFKHLGRPVVLPQLQISIDKATQDVAWQLMKAMLSPTVALQTAFIESQILWLIQHTGEQALEAGIAQPRPVRRKMVDYRLRLAMAYMRDHLDNPSVAQKVADVVGLSRSRFFELFQMQLDTSPHVYWNSVRLDEAVKRLNTSNESLTTVAIDLGFSSPGNFSRFFRDHTGVTPTTYRRSNHGL